MLFGNTHARVSLFFLVLSQFFALQAHSQSLCYTGSASLNTEEQAFLGLINAYRREKGLGPLQLSPTLTLSAKWKSQDMATKGYFSHTDSLGRDPFKLMADCNYPGSNWRGENIAAGNATASGTMVQWKNSPSHNAIMLSPSAKAIGIGRAYNASSVYRYYWTTSFGDYVDSGSVAAATPSDQTPPSVSLQGLTAGSTVSGSVVVRANVTDNVGVSGVQFQVDNKLVGSEDRSAPFEFTWNTTSVANGTHTVTAIARDTSNLQASRSVTVTVKNAVATATPTTTTTSTSSAPTTTASASSESPSTNSGKGKVSLSGSARKHRVSLQWAVAGFKTKKFEVYRSSGNGYKRIAILSGRENSFSERRSDGRYTYRVNAIGTDGRKRGSNAASVSVK